MNLFATAPVWLVWTLAALLVAAAIEDAVRLRISNVLCLGVLIGALVGVGLAGPDSSLWQNGLVFAALLGAGTILFGRGWMGGGDVKLIASTGLWCNLSTVLIFLPSVLISGGFLALIILGARTFAPAGAAARVQVLRPRAGIPYGIAIAAGGLLTLGLQRG